MIADILTSLIKRGVAWVNMCLFSGRALEGLTLIRGDYEHLLLSWMVLLCLISSLWRLKDVWFGKRGLDNDSSGDVFFVNTNTLDLSLTFDPKSKERQVL